jgi:hypothetical protein
LKINMRKIKRLILAYISKVSIFLLNMYIKKQAKK